MAMDQLPGIYTMDVCEEKCPLLNIMKLCWELLNLDLEGMVTDNVKIIESASFMFRLRYSIFGDLRQWFWP